MARHSKWSKIKRQKAVTDAKRGNVFTKHAKLIEVAARNGGDPDMNPILRAAIDKARNDNMPYDNIERAIKKGTGEAKEGLQIEEVMYEGFGPNGVALYIQALTDNKNRTITNLKIIMGKNGGTMGAAGSVGYLFQKKGLIVIDHADQKIEEIELAAIDAGAEDVQEDNESLAIITAPHDVMKIKNELEQKGYKITNAELTYVPQVEVTLPDEASSDALAHLIEALEDDDDVINVYTNAR